ncbi:hypothetical protein [Streptomyces blastmyceticus]|uniref:Uncharacterized protein n=1 Tax=Streptomyces blastmyceticus TaxID=68180 RepID=A0ABN0XJ75_9ACTN
MATPPGPPYGPPASPPPPSAPPPGGFGPGQPPWNPEPPSGGGSGRRTAIAVTVLMAVAAVALGAVLIIADKGKKGDEPGKGTSPSDSSPSFTVPSGLPSELPTHFPSRLPTSLPSGWPSGLPTGLPSGLPTSLPSGFPTGLLPVPVDGLRDPAAERAVAVTGPVRPGYPARS